MTTTNQTLTFILTCIAFGFIPGPALLQTVSLTLQHGYRIGALAALGIHFGAFIQIGVVAIGAGVILTTSPWLYHGLRTTGGAYLIWLGVQRLRSSSDADARTYRTAAPQSVLVSSILIEALNPKSALFYMSFLLQFVDSKSSLNVSWQLLLLGTCANILFSVSDLFCIALAHRLGKRAVPNGRIMALSRWLSGAVFIALGIVAIVEY